MNDRSSPFSYLEVHSCYSLSAGCDRLESLVRQALKHDLGVLPLADTNGFYGLVRYRDLAREHGLPAWVACRIRPPFGRDNQNRPLKEAAGRGALLIARDWPGYTDISRLLTECHLGTVDWRSGVSRLDEQRVFVVSDDEELLAACPHALVEIDVHQPGYFNLYRSALQAGRQPVLNHPVWFWQADDYRLHKTLRAIYHNCKLSSLRPEQLQSEAAFFKDPARLAERYAPMPAALAGAARLNREARLEWPRRRWIFPEPLNDVDRRLRERCEDGISRRYPEDKHAAARDRLYYELDIISKTGFSGYFMVVADIVNRMRYTCGRGSAAASIVSYLLFITHVDPLEHNLYFERFLHQGRSDPPDIDVDFCWDEKDVITAYVFEKYGDQAAMVSNHITFNVRSSVREIARLHGLSEDEITRVTRHIDYYYDRSRDDFVQYSGSGAADGLWPEIYRQAVQVHGLPRHLGLHCGGVVITPQPVKNYIPLERSAKGFNAIQLEKDQCEDWGLVKIDLLGNRSLAVVRDALAAVEENHGQSVRYEDLNPLGDLAVITALARGETLGVFYVESPAMRQLQKKTRRGDYEHLVLHSSIIRPAANRFINEYIERLNGRDYEVLFEPMRELLAESYGILSYQEDISRVAIELADFSVEEGDRLRKVISNRRRSAEKSRLKQRLFDNMLARGAEPEKVTLLWEMIESFAGYSFCKPHSASYALLSFKACWLKVHYGAEFMAAVLSNEGGFYGPLAYISEARRMGIQVVAPEINESRFAYRAVAGRIYTGFMAIKGLRRASVDRLIEERSRGPFRSLAECMRRTRLPPSDMRLLVQAAAFRRLHPGEDITTLLWQVDSGPGGPGQTSGRSGQLSLASLADRAAVPARARPVSRPSPRQQMVRELETFGFILASHPMKFFRGSRPAGHTSRSVNVAMAGRRLELAAIMITSKTVLTRSEELMKFVTFEDEWGLIETVLFPGAFKKYGRLLEYMQPFLLQGRVDEEFGCPVFNIEAISRYTAPGQGRNSSVG